MRMKTPLEPLRQTLSEAEIEEGDQSTQWEALLHHVEENQELELYIVDLVLRGEGMKLKLGAWSTADLELLSIRIRYELYRR